MTCLFIAYSADASIRCQEVAALVGPLEAPEGVAQTKTAVCPKVLAGFVYVGSAVIRESMPSGEGLLNVQDRAIHQNGPDTFDRAQTHARAGARGKDAKSQFFKERFSGTRPTHS